MLSQVIANNVMGIKKLGGLKGFDTFVVMPLFERMW